MKSLIYLECIIIKRYATYLNKILLKIIYNEPVLIVLYNKQLSSITHRLSIVVSA